MDFVQITTTTDTSAAAQKIADDLVAQRIAACVQVIGPITSTYRWKGSVNTSEEFMCIVKTRRALAERVEASIRSLHSYDNPEIIVMPIEGGSEDYLTWIESETTPEDG